ncbi:MAG TPA: heavy metal translocating P-type ATPase [Kiritimatiellia bacterium]|nr:heavy metal translocating P-type ATPase [Kiritimatiellia bacterium]HPS08489.1 heavy metal translocating P-type ATPase [Kiritimatiellia bacterium]
MASRRFRVRGMDCAEEMEALRLTVGRLPGVAEIRFNLLNGLMEVVTPGQEPDEARVIAAAKTAGLDVEPYGTESAGSSAGSGGAGYWRRNGRAALCGSAGLLIVAGFASHAVLHGDFFHALLGVDGGSAHRYPLASILCYTAAAVAASGFVLPKAWAAARRLRPDMNLLMTLAVVGAMAIGEWLEAATVSFLFALSLLLESWSVGRARRAIQSLLAVTPQTARMICPKDGDVLERPVGEIAVGSTIRVRPGERLPLDGVITKGATAVNQAPITGESVPVPKGPGDEVWAGTINENGTIEFHSTRLSEDTALSRIIRMVEEAQSRRAQSEQWVERFARYYTPAMMLFAVLVAVVPPLAFAEAWGAWFYEALVLLVIACPCALVISTPVSVVAALSAAAGEGVLIKGGAYLETAARLKVIALDKTGTVTLGHPEIQRIVPLNGHTEQELLERAAALEAHSGHPLALAILRYAEARQVSVPEAEAYRIFKGKGAEGRIGQRLFWLGSHRLLHEKGLETPDIHGQIEAMEDLGHSVVVIGNDAHVCGLISIADPVRKEAAMAVREMKSAGVAHLVMLTGDNEGTARAVAQAIGIGDVRAELLPEDKLQAVERFGRERGPTAMIGDGINDAPALAAAALGIAMGAAGSDAAIETSDIALMSDDLEKIPWLIRHAQRTLRVIRQNIFFALGVKALFMALALMNRGTLWMAIMADMGASLVVILNALRLLRAGR